MKGRGDEQKGPLDTAELSRLDRDCLIADSQSCVTGANIAGSAFAS